MFENGLVNPTSQPRLVLPVGAFCVGRRAVNHAFSFSEGRPPRINTHPTARFQRDFIRVHLCSFVVTFHGVLIAEIEFAARCRGPFFAGFSTFLRFFRLVAQRDFDMVVATDILVGAALTRPACCGGSRRGPADPHLVTAHVVFRTLPARKTPNWFEHRVRAHHVRNN